MHAPVDLLSSSLLRIIFHLSAKFADGKLADRISEKVQNREYFYGVEISSGRGPEFDYNKLKIPPLFTSVTWIGDVNTAADPIQEAPAVQLATQLRGSAGSVLSHLSCYRLTKERLDGFLASGVKNILAIRGDYTEENQSYSYASELVTEIRKAVGDSVSIFVGGYPEGHPEASSKDDDLKHLKEKVDAGADAIITQLCFSESAIKEFIRACRQMNITVPIIPGIYIPQSYKALEGICRFTKVNLPDEEQLQGYRDRREDDEAFQEYAVETAVQIIKNLFNSDLEIYGVQIFTLNNFENTYKCITEVF